MRYYLLLFSLLLSLASKAYYSTSPYAWFGNNPVRFVASDGMDWYMDEDSAIVWTDYGSQQEMDDNDVQGTYLGEAYVEINGSYDEQLGEGNNLFGEGAILATAFIFLILSFTKPQPFSILPSLINRLQVWI